MRAVRNIIGGVMALALGALVIYQLGLGADAALKHEASVHQCAQQADAARQRRAINRLDLENKEIEVDNARLDVQIARYKGDPTEKLQAKLEAKEKELSDMRLGQHLQGELQDFVGACQ